jgi:glycosidase
VRLAQTVLDLDRQLTDLDRDVAGIFRTHHDAAIITSLTGGDVLGAECLAVVGGSLAGFGSDAPEHREQSAKALATVLHLHRGTPYVYQGDELGTSNAGFTRLEQLRDVESLNHYATAVARGEDPGDVLRVLAYKGRDNARVPMSWDASPGAGFTAGTPWLDLHPLSGSVNAAAQVDDPNSVFSHYRRLIALRHAEPCVAHGTFRMLLATTSSCTASNAPSATPGCWSWPTCRPHLTWSPTYRSWPRGPPRSRSSRPSPAPPPPPPTRSLPGSPGSSAWPDRAVCEPTWEPSAPPPRR